MPSWGGDMSLQSEPDWVDGKAREWKGWWKRGSEATGRVEDGVTKLSTKLAR